MDRLLDRAFTRVHGDVQRVQAEHERRQGPQEPDEEEKAPDAIKRILKAWEDKEYFKLLNLPEPIADELGKPTWPCTPADVSKAYRKLSVLVHPDKNPGDEARAAFEALNETHRMLKDPSRLEEVLRVAAVRARKERDRLDALAAAQSGHAHVVASRNAATKKLRQQQGAAFEDEIKNQMKRRVEEARRKAEAVAKAKATQLQQQEETGQDSDADEESRKAHTAGDRQGQQKRAGTGSSRASRAQEDDSDEEEDALRRAKLAEAARKKRKPTILN